MSVGEVAVPGPETAGFGAAGSQPELSEAQLAMIEQFRPMVPFVARRALNGIGSCEDMERAIADGNEGLVRTVAKNYDETIADVSQSETGSKYMYRSIEGTIRHGQRRWLGRAPGGGVERNKPSVMNGTASSLEQTVDTDENSEAETLLKDRLPDVLSEQSLESALDRQVIINTVRTFSKRDREIFVRRYELGQTATAIAALVGLNQQQVSKRLQIIHQALASELTA